MRTHPATFIVEVEGTAAGLVRRDGRRGFRFFAAAADFRSIDRAKFASARQAVAAARRIKPAAEDAAEAAAAPEPQPGSAGGLAVLRRLSRRLYLFGAGLARADGAGRGAR